jgi:hypothetical protein
LTPGREDYGSPGQEVSTGQAFFGLGNVTDFHGLRPMVSQVSYYFQVFVESIDPLIKITHRPTLEKSVQNLLINQMKDISPEMELFMFAVYYSVATSMAPEEVFSSFGELKSVLCTRYRYGFEQALGNVDFLKTQELMVIQALIIFLVCYEVPRR